MSASTKYEHPFQRLCYIGPVPGGSQLLLAAAGSHIFSFSLSSGELLGQWPSTGNDSDKSDAADYGGIANDEGPPNKKRKVIKSTVNGNFSDSSGSMEIVAERAKGQRRKAKVVSATLPKVSHVILTNEKKHIVAVTTEDKCIRVFEVQKGAKLKLLSERCMSKRLCAIVLTPDDSTILAADKFGDVYSLPLLPSPIERTTPLPSASKKTAAEFEPSASELTVHTKGNLAALRQQQAQKASPAARKKEGPDFEHQHLLGHVSLLTDLIIAEGDIAGKRRKYILTADRDEHIRVSRGPSQAHIIENYCLGHKEFVSKLTILPWQEDVLVTGSGEPKIKSFRWQKGELVGDLELSEIVQKAISSYREDLSEHKPLKKLATSGLWPIQVAHEGKLTSSSRFVLVAFEGLPFLLSLEASSERGLVHHQIVELYGNPLDVAYLPEQQAILVSTDHVHKSGSVKNLRTTSHSDFLGLSNSIVSYQLGPEDQKAWKRDPRGPGPQRWRISDFEEKLSGTIRIEKDSFPVVEPTAPSNSRANYSALGEFLYGLENLRKNRGSAETGERDDAANGEEEAEDLP